MGELENKKFQELAAGALAEAEAQGEAGVARFRRAYILAFCQGFLSPILPVELDGVLDFVDPQRQAIREQGRLALRDFISSNPHSTALDRLRAGFDFMASAYESTANENERFIPEFEMVKGVRHWVNNVPEVDEVFAAEALAGASI